MVDRGEADFDALGVGTFGSAAIADAAGFAAVPAASFDGAFEHPGAHAANDNASSEPTTMR